MEGDVLREYTIYAFICQAAIKAAAIPRCKPPLSLRTYQLRIYVLVTYTRRGGL